MNQGIHTSMYRRFLTFLRPWLFPLGIVCLYGCGLLLAPESTCRALRISGAMFRQLILPICLALVIMVLFNRFLSPAAVTQFLGHSAGLKGVFLSTLAGVLSMGPIYAWYPVFKTLRDKGASDFHIANFIGSRSVKPVLLPVLVAYWGWRFSLLFVLASLVGALIVACIVDIFCPRSHVPEENGL